MSKLWARFKTNFNMNTTHPQLFWRSEWEAPTTPPTVSLLYLLFRLAVVFYFFGATLSNTVCRQDFSLYLIFLTNWSLSLQLLFSSLWLFRLLWVWFSLRRRRLVDPPLLTPPTQEMILPWPERILWVGVNLSCVLPLVVTLGYWPLIFPYIQWCGYSACEIAADLFIHGINTPMALLDLWVMAVPIRTSHMLFPITAGIIYTLFSAMYEVGGGSYGRESTKCGGLGRKRTFIYAFLDWRDHPWIALTAGVVSLGVAAFLHFAVGYGLYRARVWMRRRSGRRSVRVGVAVEEEELLEGGSLKSGVESGGLDNPTLVESGVESEALMGTASEVEIVGGGGKEEKTVGGGYSTFTK